MKIVRYTPPQFDHLQKQVTQLQAGYALRHRGFVDGYYASSDFCQLNMVLDDAGEVAAIQGIEWMPFEDQGRKLTLGFGSNYYAFRAGAGAYLSLSWLRSCDAGLIFGCSRHMKALITKAGWRFFAGVKNLRLNRRFASDPRDGALRGLAKKLVNRAPFGQPLSSLPDRLPRFMRGADVAEVDAVTEDLLDFQSAYGFRFAPGREYLDWRYGPGVPYARYRTFRVARNGRHVGYAVLLDNDAQLVVAHADGSEPTTLAAGIVKAIATIARGGRDLREVLVSSAHPAMQQVFADVGFAHQPKWDSPLALGGLKGGFDVATPVADWMVNYGWGDNALRPPFIDKPVLRPPYVGKPATRPLARAA